MVYSDICSLPWRKVRIEIQSERIRAKPDASVSQGSVGVGEYMRYMKYMRKVKYENLQEKKQLQYEDLVCVYVCK